MASVLFFNLKKYPFVSSSKLKFYLNFCHGKLIYAVKEGIEEIKATVHRIEDLARKTYDLLKAQSVHIHCRHTISAHLFFRDFSFPSLFSYSLCLSLSPSFSHSLTPPSISLSHTLLISLSLSYYPHHTLSHSPFSLSASVPFFFLSI